MHSGRNTVPLTHNLIIITKNFTVKNYQSIRNVFLVLFGLFTTLNLSSCSSEKEHEKEAETTFIVTQPIIKDTLLEKNYVSQIHAISHIEIRAQEHGFLQKIYVDEGQSVKKGQLLFQIMPKLYNAEVQKAQAEVDFAQIEYNNTKRLSDKNVVSANQLALAKAKLDKAKAELSLAQVHLGFTEIRAPFDGIIDRFHVRLGSLIDEGELMTNLSDNSQMWVYFNVSEAEYLDYKSEIADDHPMEVKLMMANGKMFAHTGIVETIEADFNNETGNIAFRATFPNPDGLLRHGETGTVVNKKMLSNALLVPQKATFEILDRKYVYVVGKDNKLVAKQIEISAEMPHLYAVSAGIDQKDKILLNGLRKVNNGDKINYKFESPSSAFSKLDLYAE